MKQTRKELERQISDWKESAYCWFYEFKGASRHETVSASRLVSLTAQYDAVCRKLSASTPETRIAPLTDDAISEAISNLGKYGKNRVATMGKLRAK